MEARAAADTAKATASSPLILSSRGGEEIALLARDGDAATHHSRLAFEDAARPLFAESQGNPV